MINEKVIINVQTSEIVLPKVLNIYKEDFGGSENEVLQFVLRYYQSEIELDDETLIKEVTQKKNILIRY